MRTCCHSLSVTYRYGKVGGVRDDAEFSAPRGTAPGRPFSSPRSKATSTPPRTRYDIRELMGMVRTLIADADRRAGELERASRRPRLEDDEW